MCSTRVSITTWNVWGQTGWALRAEGVCAALALLSPDVILLQEVNPGLLALLDARLGPLGLVRIEGAEPGWQSESCIYYRTTLFELAAFGLEPDLKMTGDYFKKRGLFWARLIVKTNTCARATLFVATAHLPWVGSAEEVATGVNQRIAPCHCINDHLARLAHDSSSLVFGGDLNEDFHPPRIIAGEGNPLHLAELFQSLDMPPPITHPVRPSDAFEEARPDRCIDWLFFRGARPLCAMAKRIRGGAFPPPSDHLPVVGVFELL